MRSSRTCRRGAALVLGVFDREEPAARACLTALGVDAEIESDAGPDAFVDLLVALQSRRTVAPAAAVRDMTPARRGRVVVVGGPAGAGRTEVAVHLAASMADVLVDADDVTPAVASRLGLPIEPNLRTAIDALEHGRGELRGSLVSIPHTQCAAVVGLPNASGWSQVRVGEVMRVVEGFVADPTVVVADCGASLEEVGGPPRGRNAVARGARARRRCDRRGVSLRLPWASRGFSPGSSRRGDWRRSCRWSSPSIARRRAGSVAARSTKS